MKVNSRKATVVLPNAPANVPENPNIGISPRASSVIILGQSMEIPIHMMSEPKNTPSTAHASSESPPMAGINREPMMTTRASTRNAVSFTLFLFCIVILLSFLSLYYFDVLNYCHIINNLVLFVKN